MVRAALSAVAERLSNMAKYDKFGIGKDGKVDPLRRMIHGIVGMGGSGASAKPVADELYSWIKGAGKGGGKKEEDDDKDNGKGNGKGNGNNSGNGGGIGDVDFNMKGEMRPPPPTKGENVSELIGDTRDPNKFKMGRNVIPNLSTGKTMKQGGLVRGAGCAQRGRGKGKMV